MKFLNLFSFNNTKKGFTLPEILLAAGIIAVIAALVVPSAVSKYQQQTFNAAYEKYKLQIQEAVDALPVTENVSSFAATSLYADVKDETGDWLNSSYDYNKAANFLRNNFKTVEVDVGDSLASDGWIIENHTFDGRFDYYACATLKSSARICIRPQTRKDPISVFLDVNGSGRNPGVLGVDIYEFSLNRYDVASATPEAENPKEPDDPED